MSQPETTPSHTPRVPQLRPIGWPDIRLAVSLGLTDFVRAPLIGLSFGLLMAVGGILAVAMLTVFDAVWLAILIAVLFPLIFPFLAAGIYEVSRRLTTGQPVTWRGVIGAVWRQRERQMSWMAFVVLFIFWVWIYQVRIVLAVFTGSIASVNLEKFLMQAISTPGGLSFLVIGSAIGLVLALVLFSATVFSLPLLFENELDFITSLIVSFKAVAGSPGPMLGLGVLLTIATVLAVVPAFLGLALIVPIFGHSTWHLYRLVTDTEVD